MIVHIPFEWCLQMRGREGERHTNHQQQFFFFFQMAEKIQHVLCKEGALPVLTLLLESPDSEVQVWLKQVRFFKQSQLGEHEPQCVEMKRWRGGKVSLEKWGNM